MRRARATARAAISPSRPAGISLSDSLRLAVIESSICSARFMALNESNAVGCRSGGRPTGNRCGPDSDVRPGLAWDGAGRGRAAQARLLQGIGPSRRRCGESAPSRHRKGLLLIARLNSVIMSSAPARPRVLQAVTGGLESTGKFQARVESLLGNFFAASAGGSGRVWAEENAQRVVVFVRHIKCRRFVSAATISDKPANTHWVV